MLAMNFLAEHLDYGTLSYMVMTFRICYNLFDDSNIRGTCFLLLIISISISVDSLLDFSILVFKST